MWNLPMGVFYTSPSGVNHKYLLVSLYSHLKVQLEYTCRPPPTGSKCPLCSTGTILFSQVAKGIYAQDHEGKYYVKCSRAYNIQSRSSWLTEAAVNAKCKGFWWVEGSHINELPTGSTPCPSNSPCKGLGQRNGSCTHWLCQKCCVERATADQTHCCQIGGHRATISTPVTPRKPGRTFQDCISFSPSPTPPTPPLQNPPSESPTPFPTPPSTFTLSIPIVTPPQTPTFLPHGRNVSNYYSTQYLPDNFVDRSLSGPTTPTPSPLSRSASRNQLAKEVASGICIGWCQTIDTNPIPLEASAPDLPYFKPSSCRLLQKVSGLDDLSEFCVAINGCWVARDKPLERLGQNTRVLLGPITLAGQECKFSEDDIMISGTSSPLKRSSPSSRQGQGTPKKRGKIIKIDSDLIHTTPERLPSISPRPESTSDETIDLTGDSNSDVEVMIDDFPPADRKEADRRFKLYQQYRAQKLHVKVAIEKAFDHPIPTQTWYRHYNKWAEKQKQI
ncbi:hypothetical protein GGX14DRAFT_658282 [Mycena pura]|uniref:Uncharacterized protein n=1 Tax=Mycena pura TaxID=153505 RepID=A0AAD7E1F7_9AGAR|nr:hypothetical protein GGX14DRAFT_658282 [Mycena pura]